MNQDSIRSLIRNGLAAMKAGSMIAAKATSEIQSDATNSILRQKLEEGNKQSKRWAEQIDRAIAEAGAADEDGNAIVEALDTVSKQIRTNAEDETARDLGIIASGQMALHYWIASFGTTASYAQYLGLEQTATAMQSCLDEAKDADEELSQVAQQIMSSQTPHQRSSQSEQMRMQ